MTIVMLAAGTSSRMGNANKMLLPYKGVPMVAHCCMEALDFLGKKGCGNTLVVVTGYMKDEVEKALEPFIRNAKESPRKPHIVLTYNEGYENGQYSSTVRAVSKVAHGEDFFISLADMPLVGPENYEALIPLLKDHDVVRPFIATQKGREPGHPVLLSHRMKKAIEENPSIGSVNRLLSTNRYDVHEASFNDGSWTFDVDTPQVYDTLSM